jgi:hypothetical protein
MTIEEIHGMLRVGGEEAAVASLVAIAGAQQDSAYAGKDFRETERRLRNEAGTAARAVIQEHAPRNCAVLTSPKGRGPSDLALLNANPRGQRLPQRNGDRRGGIAIDYQPGSARGAQLQLKDIGFLCDAEPQPVLDPIRVVVPPAQPLAVPITSTAQGMVPLEPGREYALVSM